MNDYFTKQEREQLKTAFDDLTHLCNSTKQRDMLDLHAALRTCQQDNRTLAQARLMVLRGWRAGYYAPETQAKDLYMLHKGYLTAFFLGVAHQKYVNDIGATKSRLSGIVDEVLESTKTLEDIRQAVSERIVDTVRT